MQRVYDDPNALLVVDRVKPRDKVEKITPLMVMPGIAVLSPDAWMDQVRAWGAARGDEEA